MDPTAVMTNNWRPALRAIGRTVGPIVFVACIWWAFVAALSLDPYFAKRPAAVFHYVFTVSAASAHQRVLVHALVVTLRDAAFGFIAGTVAAIVGAVMVLLSKSVQAGLMPIAIAMRAVPIVAMTPVIALVFGHDLLGVTVVAGIVTFFPTFVNVVEALNAIPDAARDLVAVEGGGAADMVRKVGLPFAVPAIFASARIGAPGAVLGAVLAEWLVTGRGLGYLMLNSSTTSQFPYLWASVFIVTVASIWLYNLIRAIEGHVVGRMFGTASRDAR